MKEIEPASPCIGICRLNPQTGLCEGCLRSREEIKKWLDYSPQEKRKVLAQLDGRRERILKEAPIKALPTTRIKSSHQS